MLSIGDKVRITNDYNGSDFSIGDEDVIIGAYASPVGIIRYALKEHIHTYPDTSLELIVESDYPEKQIYRVGDTVQIGSEQAPYESIGQVIAVRWDADYGGLNIIFYSVRICSGELKSCVYWLRECDISPYQYSLF